MLRQFYYHRLTQFVTEELIAYQLGFYGHEITIEDILC